jgi:hypothetical protein
VPDNVTVNGVLVATKDVAGAHHQRFKPSGATAAANGTATVTTSAAIVIAADGARRSALLQNTGSISIFVGTSAALTTANAIELVPGAVMMTEYNGAIYALVTAGTGPLRYWTEGD